LIFKNKDIGLTLEIGDLLLERIIDVGMQHDPNEFGGFLVGYYSEDYKQLNITDMILPKKYKATPYLFERDTVGVNERLHRFFKEEPKKYYVGEWHTHPRNLPIPSSTDYNAMVEITNHEDVAIKNPVLLIVGYRNKMVELGFYVMFKNKLYRYEQQN
jgi:[CysO sulfur-carrier protein]-S-L-cysteine hydrolase